MKNLVTIKTKQNGKVRDDKNTRNLITIDRYFNDNKNTQIYLQFCKYGKQNYFLPNIYIYTYHYENENIVYYNCIKILGFQLDFFLFFEKKRNDNNNNIVAGVVSIHYSRLKPLLLCSSTRVIFKI